MSAFHTTDELAVSLSRTEEELALSAFPTGASVAESHYFDNYDLPCPVKVTVNVPNEGSRSVVLRRAHRHGANHGDMERQIRVEKLLSEIGLPVPEVLAGPSEQLVVVSLLEGDNLQHFSKKSGKHLGKAKVLLLEALTALETVSDKLAAETTSDLLPRRSLVDELEAIADQGPWTTETLFVESVASLRPTLEQTSTPLSFTNGDHQPANFLTDGERISGFLDFEEACFRDPLMGIAKYPVYDLHPLNKAGFVDFYLEARGYDHADFAPRLALMCLTTLQKEIPVRPTNAGEESYQRHVLQLLRESIEPR